MKRAALPSLVLLIASCGTDAIVDRDASVGMDAAPAPMAMEVGPAGGTVTGPNGVSITIPAGALATTETISIVATTLMPPSTHRAASPIYQLGPDTVTFAVPVTISIPFTAGISGPKLYRSNAMGGYDEVNGTVQGNEMVGTTTHFSNWWVGLPANVAAQPTRVSFTWTVNGNSPGTMADCTKQLPGEREPRELFVKVVLAKSPTQNPYHDLSFACTSTSGYHTAMVQGTYTVDVALTTQDLRYYGFRYNGTLEVDGSGTPIEVPTVPLTNP